MKLLEHWLQEVENNFTEIVKIRRHLHKYPELSFQEEKTSDYIYQNLLAFGIEDIERNVGQGYGIVAKIKGALKGETIALRADMDALAIEENSQEEFSSVNRGVMHACGHDAHTSALLGVAKIIQKYRDELKGTIVFIFQHAEEIPPGGAKSMVEAGCLTGVDRVFGVHIDPGLPVGVIGYRRGYGSAAADIFKIKIQGRGGHAATPHLTSDSVIIASQIITNLQTIVSRNINPIRPAVISFSGVDAGGIASNIIADTAVVVGTVRTLDAETRALCKEKLISLSKLIAEIHGGSVEIEYVDGYPSIINSDGEVDFWIKSLKKVIPSSNIMELELGMGGEDFAYYLEKKPGAFFYIGVGNKDLNTDYPVHHPQFKMDEEGLKFSQKAFLSLLAQIQEVSL